MSVKFEKVVKYEEKVQVLKTRYLKVAGEVSPKELIEDAKNLYNLALKDLDAGKIRDAAEKAFGATVVATNALTLSFLGVYPLDHGARWDAFEELSEKYPDIDRTYGFSLRYGVRMNDLHNSCFYSNVCTEKTKRRIIETKKYIDDVEKLIKPIPIGYF